MVTTSIYHIWALNNVYFVQVSKPSAAPSKVPAGIDAAAKVLKMTPAEYQKQMESYLKMYKMEGQSGITQLLALQKTDPSNSMLYQQMISLLRSKINKVNITLCRENSIRRGSQMFLLPHKERRTETQEQCGCGEQLKFYSQSNSALVNKASGRSIPRKCCQDDCPYHCQRRAKKFLQHIQRVSLDDQIKLKQLPCNHRKSGQYDDNISVRDELDLEQGMRGIGIR